MADEHRYGLPQYAKDYTKDEVPTMKFTITGEKTNYFLMKVTYPERKDKFLVVDFTIIAVD